MTKDSKIYTRVVLRGYCVGATRRVILMGRRTTQFGVVALFSLLIAATVAVAVTVSGGLFFATELAVLLALAFSGAVLFAWALPA